MQIVTQGSNPRAPNPLLKLSLWNRTPVLGKEVSALIYNKKLLLASFQKTEILSSSYIHVQEQASLPTRNQYKLTQLSIL